MSEAQVVREPGDVFQRMIIVLTACFMIVSDALSQILHRHSRPAPR
jgi:hypothetical protein